MTKRVTLTFDNGPTPGITEQVLEILDREGLRCTFFVIGRKLEDTAAFRAMQAAHAAGHWIGNHTLTHSVALGDRPDAHYAATEIGRTQALIQPYARPDKLFRPYGNSGLIGPHLFSRVAIRYLLAERHCAILWNSVPGDWKDEDGWLATCLDQIAVQDWPVVVLHDIPGACLKHLPALVRRLRDQGVVFGQDFPDSVVQCRDGRIVNLDPAHVADGVP
jgi:peptidoglycan/xylan/chitin deacetylase (PgdA/CDA1 family)